MQDKVCLSSKPIILLAHLISIAGSPIWGIYRIFGRLSKSSKVFGENVGLFSRLLFVYRFVYVAACSFLFGRFVLSQESICGAFVTSYDNLTQLGFINACHRMGIFVADVQHGLAAASGNVVYQKMATYKNSQYAVIPRYYIVWSDAEREALLLEGRVRKSNAYVYNINGNTPSNAFSFGHHKKALSEVTKVFVTLQTPETNVYIYQAIRSSDVNVEWYLRPHPHYRDNKLLHQANVFYHSPSDISLLNMAKKCDLHVTYDSAAVLELARIGMISVVLSPDVNTIFATQVSKGVVVGGLSIDTVLNVVENIEIYYDEVKDGHVSIDTSDTENSVVEWLESKGEWSV